MLPPPVSRPVAPQKRSLGSLLMSTSKSSMVDSTSSISRPFTAPKMLSGSGSVDSAIVVDDDDAQSWQSAKEQFAAKKETGTSSEKVFAAEFPAVARKVLQPAEVPKLYGLVRQLHSGEDVDAALSGICDLLRDPACRELLDLMPKVLNGPMCDRFIDAAKNRGLSIEAVGNAQKSSAQGRSSDMSTFSNDFSKSEGRPSMGIFRRQQLSRIHSVWCAMISHARRLPHHSAATFAVTRVGKRYGCDVSGWDVGVY